MRAVPPVLALLSAILLLAARGSAKKQPSCMCRGGNRYVNCATTDLCHDFQAADWLASQTHSRDPVREVYATTMTLPPGSAKAQAQQRRRAKLILALGYSVQSSNTTRQFVVVVAGAREDVTPDVLSAFNKAGFRVEAVPHVQPPQWARNRFQFSFSKMNVRGLTHYDKVVLLDNDMLVVRNIDSLFAVPTPAGVAEPKREKTSSTVPGRRIPVTPGGKYPRHLCSNGGLQVLRPDASELARWLKALHGGAVKSYNSGEQGFLCAMLKPWHEVPYSFDTFVSQWLSSRTDFEQARVLHYVLLSSEKDFCEDAFKRGTGCGKEARVRWMRSAAHVKLFWDTYNSMLAAYGLDLSTW